MGSPQPFGKLIGGSLWKFFFRYQLVFALCRGWSNTTGVQRGASRPQFQAQRGSATFSSRTRVDEWRPQKACGVDPALVWDAGVSARRVAAKSQVLQQHASASAEDARECSEPEPEQVDPDSKVIAHEILVRGPRLVISNPEGIVASDSMGPCRNGASGRLLKGRVVIRPEGKPI